MSRPEARAPRNRRFPAQVSKDEWLSYMGNCQQLTDYLAKKPFKSAWFPVKFIDALLRGYGQVVFANNPLSGALIAVALTIASPQASLAGLAAACVGLLVSLALKQSPAAICAGLTVYNPLLTGLVTASTLPSMYSLQMDPLLWLFMLAAAALSVYVTSAVSSLLHSLGPYPVPCFTVPFNLAQLLLFASLVHRAPYGPVIAGRDLALPTETGWQAREPQRAPHKFTEYVDMEALRRAYEEHSRRAEVRGSSRPSTDQDVVSASTTPPVYSHSSGNTEPDKLDHSTTYSAGGNLSDALSGEYLSTGDNISSKMPEFPAVFSPGDETNQTKNFTLKLTSFFVQETPNIVSHAPDEENVTSDIVNENVSEELRNHSSETYSFTEYNSSPSMQNQNESNGKDDSASYFSSTVSPETPQTLSNSLRADVTLPDEIPSFKTQDFTAAFPFHNENHTYDIESNISNITFPLVQEIPDNVTNTSMEENAVSDSELIVTENVGGNKGYDSSDTHHFLQHNESTSRQGENQLSTTGDNSSASPETPHSPGASEHPAGSEWSQEEMEDGSPYALGEDDGNTTAARERRAAGDWNSTAGPGNTTTPRHDVDWGQVFAGTVLSASQVYGFCDAPASATIYLAILVFSPTMAAFSASGALLATLTGVVFGSPPYTDVYAGEWGMQGLLCAAALGGFCYVLTLQTAVAAHCCALLAAVLKHVLSGSYAAANLPIMSLPFNLATILFLYVTSVSEDFVQPEQLSFPEKHWFDLRQQRRAQRLQEADKQQSPPEDGNAEEEKKLRIPEEEKEVA
ncbi:uncharacterized protein LOC134527800 [Bacillus rossius redtenbacheri]|uniref:uncharacterized protein LOC134527800 n=1 Tax=Bacillus rossius redtenbacheri TaxID=93214 RepID=UPI002FDD1BAB